MTVLLGYENVGPSKVDRLLAEGRAPGGDQPGAAAFAGQAPQVDRHLQATLDYFWNTLPVHWGALSPAGLTDDQKRKSSTEMEAQADTHVQVDPSIDVDADGFAEAGLTKAVHVDPRAAGQAREYGAQETISRACGVRWFRPERADAICRRMTSGHRGPRNGHMQLLGFHFVSGLDGDIRQWRATTDAVVH
jgi:hypothetical protein